MKSPKKSIKSGVICEGVPPALARMDEVTEVVTEATLAATELAVEEMLEAMEETLFALSEAMDDIASVAFSKDPLTIVLKFAGGQIYWCRTSQPLMRSAANGLYGKFGSWEDSVPDTPRDLGDAYLAAGCEEAEMHSAGHARVREGVEGDRSLRIRQESTVEACKTIYSRIN